MLILLYWAFIPNYCKDTVECHLNSSITSGAYGWFMAVLIILMVATNILTAINCPSQNKIVNVGYAIFSTLACWSIFIFIVYGREYLRMSFANVFGYMWVSKKANEIITKLIPKNYVDLEELITKLTKETENNTTKYPIDKQSITELIESVPKTRIDDNFELLTYLRSGTNYVSSLKYVKDFTNKVFREDIGTAIDQGEPSVKTNTDLVELLNILYTRDVIGEIILFVLASVMCIYLSEYLIKKINCSYKTPEEIQKGIDDYNAEYNKQQEMEKNQIVVTV
jgi:hypothetical protein